MNMQEKVEEREVWVEPELVAHDSLVDVTLGGGFCIEGGVLCS